MCTCVKGFQVQGKLGFGYVGQACFWNINQKEINLYLKYLKFVVMIICK